MADRSLQHHPFELSHTRTRQASTSSSDQSSATEGKPTSSQPRRRRLSPSLGLPQLPIGHSSEPSRRRGSKQTSLGPREKSSRGPSTNMSTTSDPAGEITYTPTTHRISKAKKGKKVHVCEYPGCGKIFTRAEHRKRHEANHNPEPAFHCRFEDCRKPFQRADLLARHMERQHEMPAGTVHPRSQRSTSEASSNPPSRGTMAPSIGQSQTVNAQAMSHGHGAMAITSIIEHPVRGNELSMPGPSMGEVTHAGIGPIPPSFRPEWSYGPMGSADSPMYSSDCSSPMSDYPNAQMAYLQRPPSTFSDSSFHQQPVTSPLSAGPSYAPTWDPPLQLPFAHVDEQQWHPIRTQPVSTAAVAMGKSSLLKAQNPQTQHYLDRYWEYFHPLFPIVHFPSFMSTIPQPLLAASMVVIGAQYSPRPDAKQYSASLHAECAKLLSDRGPLTSRSSVFDLQTNFHLELFTRFRARSGKLESIQGSAEFTSVYSSLIADQEFLQVDQASLHQTLPPPSAPAHLEAVYSRWVEHEIRRRILVAMFVLDTQHSHLFQRQSSYSGNLTKEDGLDLPFPTSTEIWNCPDVPTWRELIASHEAFSINTLGPNHHHHPPLDPFQSSLLTCCHVHRSRLSGTPTQYDLVYQPSKSHVHHAAAARTHHSLSMSTHAPLHALLITASESWLFGTKITDEAIWYRSKATLRKWVTGPGALKAVWHATRLLRLAIIKRDDSAPSREADDQGGCYYLHDPWCLYVAALVCWAFGSGNTTVEGRPEEEEEESLTDNNHDAEALAVEYLDAMDVLDWRDVRNVAGVRVRKTRGVLECVRLRIGESGMGGLLDGAEDVLFRLVEGGSSLLGF